jgi:hypothetical protein
LDIQAAVLAHTAPVSPIFAPVNNPVAVANMPVDVVSVASN